jgi:hypothetical protein
MDISMESDNLPCCKKNDAKMWFHLLGIGPPNLSVFL